MGISRAVAVFLLLCTIVHCTFSHEITHSRPHSIVSSGPFNLGDSLAAQSSRAAALRILTPSELIAQYNIVYSATAGSGKTIAIVDAYGASTVEADLAVFNEQFGLPACTTANGCFTKVNQTGGTSYPPDDTQNGWGTEVALDVQTVHAVAPGAKILLVVAISAGSNDLYQAVGYARANADYVSMSFGASESLYVTTYNDEYFSASPHVAFFASTGDSAAGIEFPASSPNVVAVGGTSLYTNSDYSFSSEEGWADGGGGCSAYFDAPAMQVANSGYASLGCNGKRALPDVAMDANSNSGVYVYYSYGCASPPNCYFQIGGTSLAAPLFAARAAIRGAVVNVTYVYGNHIQYRDIVMGSNGFACKTGLDLVTGLGSWIGDL